MNKYTHESCMCDRWTHSNCIRKLTANFDSEIFILQKKSKLGYQQLGGSEMMENTSVFL